MSSRSASSRRGPSRLRAGIVALALSALVVTGCDAGHGTAAPAKPTGPVPGVPSGPRTAASSPALRVAPRPTAAVPATAGRTGRRWAPAPGTTWQWQLTGPLDLTVDADVYDIDGFDNGADVVAELHRRGRKAVCYIEAGAYADFRPDRGDWPADLIGKPNGWPGERWVDIRDPGRLEPVLSKRFDMCRDKGFDGVEPDLMEHFTNDTGFPITARDQIVFNRFLARLGHDRGLSVALKNDVEQVSELVGDFDFTVNEECFAFHECAALRPFIAAGKAVLHAEYDVAPGTYCPQTTGFGLSSIHKDRDLDASRQAC